MSLKLYGHPLSTCTTRVLITAAELGIEVELVEVDLPKGAHKAPDFIEKQPFGAVPYFRDESVSTALEIYESRAISRYLVLKSGSKGLMPLPNEDNFLANYAVFEQAASVEYQNLDPPASALAYEAFFKKMAGHGEPDQSLIDSLVSTLSTKLDGYERILAKHQYLAGDSYTLADLFHIPYGHYIFKAGKGDLITSRPNVNRWWNAINEREASKKVMEATLSFFSQVVGTQ